ncbi:MAG: BON domain-containing protein [Terriglobia bacterium]
MLARSAGRENRFVGGLASTPNLQGLDEKAPVGIGQNYSGPQTLTGGITSNQIAVLPPGDKGDTKTVNSDLDKAIGKNLDAALIQSRLHKAVSYDVKNSVVTLTGEVNSPAKRAQAEKVASGIPNVQQVVNELQVKDQKASSTQ